MCVNGPVFYFIPGSSVLSKNAHFARHFFSNAPNCGTKSFVVVIAQENEKTCDRDAKNDSIVCCF